jgi:hypothetical protein
MIRAVVDGHRASRAPAARMRREKMMRCSTASLVIAGIALGGGAPASGAFIDGFGLLDSPDVASRFIDVTFDAGTDAFVASGFALAYDDGTPPGDDIIDGSFLITASIADDGAAGAGSLDIGGTIGLLGPSLLTASLVDFGFSDAGGMLLQFVFAVTGGDLAGAYGGVGALVGVSMDVDSDGYPAGWTKSWDNNDGVPGAGGGVADAAPLVPSPPTVALLALALVGRRRSRR